ncbi:Sec-independent protein translocase TatA [Winogradskyella sp. PC-19]|jgi:sec-independent protein translocase protein TatA|uniref:Sec-independent protein translocase subunit TatA/TatB n=1 Tax=unclassified Winogradskyella TaxID=2615021 RepID=UPI000B3CA588|nr:MULTISPECIES: twin-arginine translocase TatA/TatE family subunit [unclassified Winogradskyella]ARV10265.1 Sec-independent protein translocase TatA [Winogradskyella sp. PC-19]RZN78559.1 MAG: twin-arginine translocase TatA/TatE family subunit [Winogradskyella sp.]
MFSQSILLFIGGTEIIFILFIVVMVFGADKIPEIARGLGKGMRTLKDATNDIKHEVTKSAKENGIIDTEVTQSINEELNKVRDEVEDFAGSVKRKP